MLELPDAECEWWLIVLGMGNRTALQGGHCLYYGSYMFKFGSVKCFINFMMPCTITDIQWLEQELCFSKSHSVLARTLEICVNSETFQKLIFTI